MSGARHDRLTELFAEAVDLPPDARAQLVRRIGAEDTTLAADLASLLAADDLAEERSSAGLATGGLAPTLDDKPFRIDPVKPLTVPGYRVRGVLGEGGMGTVYDGEQEEPHRRVAIKVLHARSGNALVRFKTEAQIMARLDHPGIARVLEAGEADGHPFLVMEHVDGETLDEVAPKLTLAQRLRLFVQLCDAVHHAHLKGVIHRDLKPSNVMVKGRENVVVLDFGVARLAADDGTTPGATRAGELIGTPIYMSPEQARLRADEVDARSDVYTLGVMLYELACGELPYAVRGLPLPAVTVVITEDPPVPLGKHSRELAGDLEAITGKTLHKDPRDRYQSVAALAEDVRRYMAGLPVSVRTPGTVERVRRYVRRKPLVAAAIAGSVLAAATFGVVVTALWLDARSARRTAEAAQATAEHANGELEARTNQLVLRQARSALGRDPTEALGWLKTLTPRDVDPGTAWMIADEALARGVARDVVKGHADEVHWVEPLPGASAGAFVTGAYDGKAIVWEGTPLAPHVVYAAAHGRVHAARPSPDGSRIAVGGDDGELHVVARDGTPIATLPGHRGDVQQLAWSPDGAWLATGDDHGKIQLWADGKGEGSVLVTGSSPIGWISFSDTGRRLIGGDHAGHIWVWNLATRARTDRATGTDIVAAWSDDDRLISVDAEGVVRTWRGDALAPERTVETRAKCKRAVFAAGGAWVLLGGVGGAVTRVEGDAIETLGLHRSQVRSLAISPDGAWIASGGDDGTLVIRDKTGRRSLQLRGHGGRIRHLAFERAGLVLLSSDSEGVVRVWDLAALPATVLEPDAAVTKMAASADGARLAAVDAAGSVSVWTLGDGHRTVLGHIDGRVTEIAIAGATVVTGTAEGGVTFWTAKPVATRLEGIIKSIAVSGDRVAVATSAGPISMFTSDGTPRGKVDGDPGGTEVCAFDPSGTLIAAGGQDRAVHVWSIAGDTYTAQPPLEGGIGGDTHVVAFSPRGDRLVSGSNDGAVMMWRVEGGQVRASTRIAVTRHTGAISAIAFDPTGEWIASAGRDNQLVRSPRSGASETVQLSTAALAIAFDDAGTLHAVTRAGAVQRWTPGHPPAIEIEHGVTDGVPIAAAHRWALAHEDGAIVLASLEAHGLPDLVALLARVTSYTLPAH